MKRQEIYDIVCGVAQEFGYGVDQYAEDVTDRVIDDNGFNLTEEDVVELAGQFYDEDEYDEDEPEDDWNRPLTRAEKVKVIIAGLVFLLCFLQAAYYNTIFLQAGLIR